MLLTSFVENDGVDVIFRVDMFGFDTTIIDDDDDDDDDDNIDDLVKVKEKKPLLSFRCKCNNVKAIQFLMLDSHNSS